MLLSKAIEEQHVLSRRRRLPAENYPGALLRWAIEVEKTHTDRLLSLFESVCDETVIVVSVRESTTGTSSKKNDDRSKSTTTVPRIGCSSLIFSNINMVTESKLPPEAFRSMHRMFLVPQSCNDPISIISHPLFLSLLRSATANNTLIFKVQTSPKQLECHLIKMITSNLDPELLTFLSFENILANYSVTTWDDNVDKKEHQNISKVLNSNCYGEVDDDSEDAKHTHILQCIYGVDDGVFRWGIVSTEASVRHRLTAESIEADIENERIKRFERDDILREEVAKRSNGLINTDNNHNTGSCNIYSDLDDNENSRTTTPHSSSSNSQQNLVSPGNENNNYENNTEKFSNSSPNVPRRTLFSPASRAYYKMSEIKEFYFPLWGWIWPGDEGGGGSDIGGEETKMILKSDYLIPVEVESELRLKEHREKQQQGQKQDHMYTHQYNNQTQQQQQRDLAGLPIRPDATTTGTFETTAAAAAAATVATQITPTPTPTTTTAHTTTTTTKTTLPIKIPTKSRTTTRRSRQGLCSSVDVGSSPGGWTQCLAAHCHTVISVDPGLLRQDVLDLKNVRYVCGTIQSDAAQNAMREISGRNYCDNLSASSGNKKEKEKEKDNIGDGSENSIMNTDSDIEYNKNKNVDSERKHDNDRNQNRDGRNSDDYRTNENNYKGINKNFNEDINGNINVKTNKNINENNSISLKDNNNNNNRLISSNAVDGTYKSTNTYGTGLRVVVCDVNIGAATAATLLSTFVLPHMKSSCKCFCIVSTADQNENVQTDKKDYKIQDNMSGNDDENDGKEDENNKNCNNNEKIKNNENIIECNSPLENSQNKPKMPCLCGGFVVLTLKLVKNAKENYIKSATKSACDILGTAGCSDFRIVHLGANSKNERTLVCRYGGDINKKLDC